MGRILWGCKDGRKTVVGQEGQLTGNAPGGASGVGAMLGHLLRDAAMQGGDSRRIWAFWCAVVGLAFWWPLMRNSVTGFVFTVAADDLAGFSSRDALCLFAAVVLAIAGVGGLAARRPGLRRVAPWFVPLLGVLSSVANGCAMAMPEAGSLAASAALLAAVFVGFSAAWGSWIVGWASGGREVLLLAALSYAASFLVGYLSYLPVPFALVRPLGAPLVSGLCWYGCWRLGMGRGAAGLGGTGVPEKGSPAASLRRSLYILVLVFFLVGSVATGFINTGSVAYVPSGGTLIRDTLSLVLTLGLMGLVVAVGRLDRAEFLLVSLLGASQFAGIFIATFFSESLLPYGAGLMQASKSWFSVMLFVLVLAGCNGVAECVRRVFLCFVVPAGLSVAVSYLAVPALVASFDIAYEGFWGTLSLAMGFFLGVLVFVFLSSIAVRSLPAEGNAIPTVMFVPDDAKPMAGVEAVARALGEERVCTAREQDVLALLVAGNTLKRVAELLNVTENTVQYHSKNIYRKFGVHTKQELVDLVARGR